MTGKAMLILEQKLVEKIDENRDDLSRADFIEFCIDNCLREIEPEEAERKEPDIAEETLATKPKETAIYATREEFREFKRGITNLLRTFLDFFITFGLELGTSKPAETVEQLKSQLRAILEEQ